MKTTIVTTTISIPYFLSEYAANAKRFGHQVDFIVAGDAKSDPATSSFCAEIPDCLYMDIDAQNEFLTRFPRLSKRLPINSVERRNVAILKAYTYGADVIITLDDDNFATSHDAVGTHQIVASEKPELVTVGSSTGWLNVCRILKEKNNVDFYHRGYPAKERWNDGFLTSQFANHRVVVNAGLWVGDPDIDAITRLERKLVVTGIKKGISHIALAPGTWSPFNCQNTALHRDVIPAYFLSPYAGRHSDILASFVINRLTEHFGHVISFGNPLAYHKRSPHDLWKDMDAERDGMQVADEFCASLRDMDLTAETYHQGFGEIIDRFDSWSPVKYEILDGMIAWHQAFEILGAK